MKVHLGTGQHGCVGTQASFWCERPGVNGKKGYRFNRRIPLREEGVARLWFAGSTSRDIFMAAV